MCWEDSFVQGRASNLSVSMPMRVAVIVPLISAGNEGVMEPAMDGMVLPTPPHFRG